MADAPPDPDQPSYTPAPAWVKVFGILTIVAFAVLLVMLVSGGDHGPGRHTGGRPEHAPVSSDGGHKAPAGGHGP